DPEGTVMTSAIVHPIAYRDASYYGTPLIESRDRLCRAVRASRWSASLPPCDLGADIAARLPLVIDHRVLANLPRHRTTALPPLLRARYRPAGTFMVLTREPPAGPNRTRLPTTSHGSTSSRRSASG